MTDCVASSSTSAKRFVMNGRNRSELNIVCAFKKYGKQTTVKLTTVTKERPPDVAFNVIPQVCRFDNDTVLCVIDIVGLALPPEAEGGDG